MEGLEPTGDQVVAPPAVPPAVVAVKRRFAWREFVLGMVAGVAALLLLMAVGFVLLVVAVRSMAGDMTSGAGISAPAPELPMRSPLPVYGMADRGWAFHTLDGAPATLADFKDQVVVLNFWATWCGPCVAEMPSLDRLRKALSADPVAFVLVSNEDAATIRAFLAKKSFSLTSYRSQASPPGLFASDGIPTTFILAPDGRIIVRHVGMARWDDPTTIAFIRRLASAK
jgi:thiol-disulfide isomerase/thioredoxin